MTPPVSPQRAGGSNKRTPLSSSWAGRHQEKEKGVTEEESQEGLVQPLALGNYLNIPVLLMRSLIPKKVICIPEQDL